MSSRFPSGSRRRRRVLDEPLPDAWRRMLYGEIPLCMQLPESDRPELEDRLRIFLDEKRFHGCAGLVVGEAMRVVIAAQACLLLLRRETDIYPGVRSVLLYPEAFVVPVEEWSEDGMVVTQASEVRIGEAADTGNVVLSWADVQADLAEPFHGQNVVIHEFSHQLDLENGASDGAPALPDPATRKAWARTLQDEYDALWLAAERGEETFLDPYAAEDPAEFFAVVSEYFFDLPAELRARHPALYGQLKSYYGQDPAGWSGASPA